LDKHVDEIAAKLGSLGWAGAEHVKRNLTAREIKTELEEVLQFIRGCALEGPPITVLLWFSGHGLTFFGTQFLLGVDALHHCVGVPWVEIQKMLDVRGPGGRPVRIIALLSACRSPNHSPDGCCWLHYALSLCRWRCCLKRAHRVARQTDPGSLVAWACSEGSEAAPGVMSNVFAEQLQGGEHGLQNILNELRTRGPALCMDMGAEPQAVDIHDNLRERNFSFDVRCH